MDSAANFTGLEDLHIPMHPPKFTSTTELINEEKTLMEERKIKFNFYV